MKNLKEEILKHLPASAKTLAKKLKVSRVSVYRALKAHRPRLEREKVREGATGPLSVVWSESKRSTRGYAASRASVARAALANRPEGG